MHISGKGEHIPGQPKKCWEAMSIQRKNVSVGRATTAIVATLKVIALEDAGHLWKAVQSSHNLEKALGLNKKPADKKYLKALAETYQHTMSWDTRRQVLSITANVVLFQIALRLKYKLNHLKVMLM